VICEFRSSTSALAPKEQAAKRPGEEGSGVTTEGVGARLLRKEDDRYIRGQGLFVGDINLSPMPASDQS
jgi:hypothetical protein